MDKLMKLLTLDSLKGSRTKFTIILDIILYAVSVLAPQFISPEMWGTLQPIFISVGAYFGIEHFEKKGA